MSYSTCGSNRLIQKCISLLISQPYTIIDSTITMGRYILEDAPV